MTAWSETCPVCHQAAGLARDAKGRCLGCSDVEQRWAIAFPGETPSPLELSFFARNGRRIGIGQGLGGMKPAAPAAAAVEEPPVPDPILERVDDLSRQAALVLTARTAAERIKGLELAAAWSETWRDWCERGEQTSRRGAQDATHTRQRIRINADLGPAGSPNWREIELGWHVDARIVLTVFGLANTGTPIADWEPAEDAALAAIVEQLRGERAAAAAAAPAGTVPETTTAKTPRIGPDLPAGVSAAYQAGDVAAFCAAAIDDATDATAETLRDEIMADRHPGGALGCRGSIYPAGLSPEPEAAAAIPEGATCAPPEPGLGYCKPHNLYYRKDEGPGTCPQCDGRQVEEPMPSIETQGPTDVMTEFDEPVDKRGPGRDTRTATAAPRPPVPQPKPGGANMTQSPSPAAAAAAPRPPSPVTPPPPAAGGAGKPPTDDLSTPAVARGLPPSRLGIVPARRSRGFLKIALIAVSYGGKSYSAIQLARGIVEGLGHAVDRRGPGCSWWRYDVEPAGPARILVVDTEKSAHDYDHLGPFDVVELEEPYTLPRYRQGYDLAVAGGYDALVIDSGSHLWSGEGGVLQQVDQMGGDKRQAWAKANPAWEGFKTGIIAHTHLHLIVCFRAKTVIEVVNGKRVKVGIDAIARAEIEYEFNAAFELEHATHLATIEKDRTEVFKDRPPFVITPETGKELLAWRLSGAADRAEPVSSIPGGEVAAPATATTAATTVAGATGKQRERIKTLMTAAGLDGPTVKAQAGVEPGALTAEGAAKMLTYLEALAKTATDSPAGELDQ